MLVCVAIVGRNSIELAEAFTAILTAVLAKTIERLVVFDIGMFTVPAVAVITDDSE